MIPDETKQPLDLAALRRLADTAHTVEEDFDSYLATMWVRDLADALSALLDYIDTLRGEAVTLANRGLAMLEANHPDGLGWFNDEIGWQHDARAFLDRVSSETPKGDGE